MADGQSHVLVVASVVVLDSFLLGASGDNVIVELAPLLWTKHKLINNRESSTKSTTVLLIWQNSKLSTEKAELKK